VLIHARNMFLIDVTWEQYCNNSAFWLAIYSI